MHRIRCFAEGGFKINGPPENGKGPMSQGNNLGTRDKASLPKPTQVGRIETCTELIRQAKKCLEDNNRNCAVQTLEKIIENGCHKVHAAGKEIVNETRGIFHTLWLMSNNDRQRCELLKMLSNLGVSRRWVRDSLNENSKRVNKLLEECNVKMERRVPRYEVIEEIESLLEKFGWNRDKECEELLRFIGIDVNMLKRHGINPCNWIYAETSIHYIIGIVASDISDRVVETRNNEYVKVSLKTTESISAIVFPKILSNIGRPSVTFVWDNGTPQQRGRTGIIAIEYYIYVKKEEWKWLNIEELIKYIRALRPEDVPKLIAGIIDGDGTIYYNIENSALVITITACRSCGKRALLDAAQEALRKLGIESKIYEYETDPRARLGVYGENAIKLLRLIVPYLHHPIKRLRAELILMLRDGKIDREAFTTLYGLTEYGDKDDPKRYHGLEALARAAPQTHTHGNKNHQPHKKELNNLVPPPGFEPGTYRFPLAVAFQPCRHGG